MKLQCVSVCVNYADFFKHVAAENKGIFDKWVVVTDLEDVLVEEICKEHGYTCIKTNVFYEKGIFNKYAGINEGLKYIDKDAWVLFLDSDIVLQKETKRILRELNLNEEKIYGIDRLNCIGYKNWKRYKEGRGILANNWILTTAGLELGARLVHYYGHEGENGRFEGWRPLGFFQLCHHSQFIKYPENTLGADHCDLLFARKWKRDQRVLIPELFAIHLESRGAHHSVNWYGRKSEPFLDDDCGVCIGVREDDNYYGDTLSQIKQRLLNSIYTTEGQKISLTLATAENLPQVVKDVCENIKDKIKQKDDK